MNGIGVHDMKFTKNELEGFFNSIYNMLDKLSSFLLSFYFPCLPRLCNSNPDKGALPINLRR